MRSLIPPTGTVTRGLIHSLYVSTLKHEPDKPESAIDISLDVVAMATPPSEI